MSKRQRRGVVQTGLDIAIGGTAMAIDKASEIIHEARERAEGAAEKTRDRVAEAAERAEREAKHARKQVERKLVGPDTRPYEERTFEELRELAAERHVDGRSKMNKEELIQELRS